MTYESHDKKFIEGQQYFGTIVNIDVKEGMVIKLSGSGKEFKLPPDLNNIKDTRPGAYRLRSTGEVIVNPDFLTTWTVTKPQNAN